MSIVGTGEFTIVDVTDGSSTYLTQNSAIVASDSAGVVSSFSGAETNFKIIENGVDKTDTWSYYVSATGGGISYRDSDDTSDRTLTGIINGGLGGVNLITNSATFQPIGGGPSFTTYVIDQIAPDGTTSGSRVTIAGSREFIEYAVSNTTYVFSFFVKLMSGSRSLTLTLKDRATDTVRGTSTLTATTDWQRFQVTGTVAGASAGVRIELTGFAVGDVYWGAQLEPGTSATEYTATGATARSGTRGYVKITALSQDLSYLDISATKLYGATITHRFSIAKSRQGITGVRGTITTSASIAGTAWVDASADAAISAAGGGTPLQGDVVTLYNNAQSFSQTRVRSSGGTWTALTALFGGDVIVDNTLSANKIVTNSITSGKIGVGEIKATNIAASAIVTSKLFVSGRGPAINDDQFFTDTTAWSTSADVTFVTNGSLSTVSGAQGSSYVTSSTGGSNGYAGSMKYGVSPFQTYRLTANLYAAAGNNRNIYIYVRFFAADGVTEITGTGWGGTYGGYVYGGTPTTGVWSLQGSLFGFGTSKLIPSNAAYMMIGVWFQYNGSGTSSVQQACQNLYVTTAVDNSLIVDGTINATKLVAHSISATQIAAGTITADEIAAGTITGAKISAGTIEGANIAAGTILAGNIAAASITGDKIAANTISASNILANTITAGQIQAGSITTEQIAAQTITAGNIAAGTITAAQIAAATITGNLIAANTIAADNLIANSITAGQIAAFAIGADQIAAGAIRTDKLYVTGRGKALNDDPACSDISAWTVEMGSLTVVTLTTGAIANNTVLYADGTTIFRSKAFPVSSGTSYKISTYLRLSGGTGNFYIRVEMYDINNNIINQTVTGLSPITTALDNIATPSSWTRYSGVIIAGANTVRAAITITANSSGIGGKTYFSDLRIEERLGADLIVDGSITAVQIATNSITADRINGLNLSVVNGSFSGTLNAATGTFGAVTVASTGSISSGQTAFNTGTGFWLDSNGGTGRFSVGDSSSNYLTFNGTTLSIKSSDLSLGNANKTSAIGYGTTDYGGNSSYLGFCSGANFINDASTTYNNVAIGPFAAGYYGFDVNGVNYNTRVRYGRNNVTIGQGAGTRLGDTAYNADTAASNTIIGSGAGSQLTTESRNTYIGALAGYNINGSGNTILGAYFNASGMPLTANNTVILSDGNGLARLYSDENNVNYTGYHYSDGTNGTLFASYCRLHLNVFTISCNASYSRSAGSNTVTVTASPYVLGLAVGKYNNTFLNISINSGTLSGGTYTGAINVTSVGANSVTFTFTTPYDNSAASGSLTINMIAKDVSPNVTAISRNGTGDFTIYFYGLPDAGYTVVATGSSSNGYGTTNGIYCAELMSGISNYGTPYRTASSVRIITLGTDGSYQNSTSLSIAIFK